MTEGVVTMAAGDRMELTTFRQRTVSAKPDTGANRARARFAKALQTLVDEKLVDKSLSGLPELEMLEAATELTKE